METRANYLLVGLFVLVFTFGGFAFVLWLAKFQFDTDFRKYDIRYEGSVTGLNEGSPVRYRGVRVGEVTRIRLNPQDPEEVRITIEIDATTPVRSDTVATLELESIASGVLYVQLSETSKESAPLTVEPGEPRPVIESRTSGLQELFQGAPEIMRKVDSLLEKANDILDDENRGRIDSTLANLDDFSGVLADRGGDIATIIQDARITMESARDATAAMGKMAATFERETPRVFAQIEDTLRTFELMAQGIDRSVGLTAEHIETLIGDIRTSSKSFTSLSSELQAMIAENREPIRDFTATGLAELTVLVVELRDLAVALRRVTTELERDPARFLFGDRQQGYEAR